MALSTCCVSAALPRRPIPPRHRSRQICCFCFPALLLSCSGALVLPALACRWVSRLLPDLAISQLSVPGPAAKPAEGRSDTHRSSILIAPLTFRRSDSSRNTQISGARRRPEWGRWNPLAGRELRARSNREIVHLPVRILEFGTESINVNEQRAE